MVEPSLSADSEIAEKSAAFIEPIRLNVFSMAPGEKITKNRAGRSDRLHHACGVPLLTVATSPANRFSLSSPWVR